MGNTYYSCSMFLQPCESSYLYGVPVYLRVIDLLDDLLTCDGLSRVRCSTIFKIIVPTGRYGTSLRTTVLNLVQLYMVVIYLTRKPGYLKRTVNI
eukprot:SAG31_NODE_743_length_12418_cov_3.780908_2_plen_95_part_00